MKKMIAIAVALAFLVSGFSAAMAASLPVKGKKIPPPSPFKHKAGRPGKSTVKGN